MKNIILICLVVMIAGCGRELTEGEVVGKYYEPDRTFVMLMPMAISCGQSCISTMMIPYIMYDDEDYVLIISGRDRNGNLITEEWYVDKDTYEKAETGRREVFESSGASRDDDHEKVSRAG